MNNRFNFVFLLVLALSSLNLFAQEEYNFIVVDTVTMESPVLFNLSKYDGEFIVEKQHLKNNSDKKRLIKKGKVYIYSNDFYYYLNSDKFNSYDYPDNGGCRNNKKVINDNGLSYSHFVDRPKKFIVCLINALYYDKKSATADIGKTYYHKSKKDTYYKILFPLCE